MKQEIKELGTNKTCQLCRSSENDEIRYGKLYEYEDLIVHHFCLLFAPGCPQNGKDEEGIEGFLPQDVKKEIKRVRNLICCFCKKNGANLGCCNEKHVFGAYHTNCAWKNDVSFQFTSSFTTYCKKHNIYKQKSFKSIDCQICFDKIKTKEKSRTILMRCCKNTFHRDCLQNYALNAGVYFKCPLCNDKDNIKGLKEQGIFIPERDALWELEENAFSEFYQPLQLICESKKCRNKNKNAESVYMWNLCQYCGANGIHLTCFDGDINDSFTCSECNLALSNAENRKNESKIINNENKLDIKENKSIKKEKIIKKTWISDEEIIDTDTDDEILPSPPRKKRKLRNKQTI
ncbi:hypothetical protein PVAND_011071 [Polypedilum vanderplanki]|uniref:Uncharacterized protein n=1 Tax=Polypedilum vanderplanki TaxID=319348 RepID=A0A9J6CHI3_POLVA|nr:hypothetical protein PVAND_011071 [Polypedilum vanderplanki]